MGGALHPSEGFWKKKAGQRFGPDLAAALKSKGKDVTVISSTGMVHPTGAGIASYAPSANFQEAQQKHGFTGFVATEAIEKVWKMREQLSDNVDKALPHIKCACLLRKA